MILYKYFKYQKMTIIPPKELLLGIIKNDLNEVQKFNDFSIGYYQMGYTPLMISAEYGSIDVLMYLVDHETTNINAKDSFGFTALSRANTCEQYDKVKIFTDVYVKYIVMIKDILKYLGLENIYYIVNKIIGEDIDSQKLKTVVYR